MKSIIEFIVKTDGCYAGIFDMDSPIHKNENFPSIWAKAIFDAMGEKSPIFGLNAHLLESSRRGEILSWVLLQDDYFTVRIEILNEGEKNELNLFHQRNFLNEEFHDLSCPTGHLAVASLHELGTSNLRANIEVNPGTYQVGLLLDEEDISRYLLSADKSNYVQNERPDWIIALQKIG